MTRRHVLIFAGVLGLAAVLFAATIAGAVWLVFQRLRPAPPREALAVRLVEKGPYVILTTHRAAKEFVQAIDIATRLHEGAEAIAFDPADLSAVKSRLAEIAPEYAMVFILPSELDVNFAWEWLAMTTELDDDPLVDVKSGFITGRDGKAAARFMTRIERASRGEQSLAGKMIDNLGPNTAAAADAFYLTRGAFMAPVFDERYSLATISHGEEGFTDEHLAKLADAGLIHFGGHGYPDCIVGGVRAGQVQKLELGPCVVWSGACYTGVTEKWFDRDERGTAMTEKSVAADESFCLNLLDNETIGYFAALHPDHGIPVYQEMEYLAYTGGSLGDAIKHTHDGVILARGEDAAPGRLVAGDPWPKWSNAEVMLHGTAARVLFGDPSLVVGEKFTEPPFDIELETKTESELRATATLNNSRLMATFTDTYYSDLAADKQMFNDTARFAVELPSDWEGVADVKVTDATADGQPLVHRLVGFAFERDGADRRVHVQVDFAAQGYMQSDFRSGKSRVTVSLKRN